MLRYYGKFNLFDSSTLIELLERERRGGEFDSWALAELYGMENS